MKEPETQSHLLKQKRFLPFFATQFLGAFNDNLYKNALMLMLAVSGTSLLGLHDSGLLNLAAFLFILPFFLFSALAGQIADKYEMAKIIQYTKLAEIIIMGLAAAAFYFESYLLLLTLLFFMGAQSAFFGPAKYAILPKVLNEKELIGGNALVEMGTFIAILLGTLSAGVILSSSNHAAYYLMFFVLLIAVLGYLASLNIATVGRGDSALTLKFNIFAETFALLKKAKQDKPIFLSILAISWFWFLGASYLTQIPVLGLDVLGMGQAGVTVLLAFFTIGIGTGSILCERLSRHRVELGIVPLGTLGLSLFGLDLYFALPDAPAQTENLWQILGDFTYLRVCLDILALGVFGGLFIVPLYAYIQMRAKLAERAQMIAVNNVMNALLMVISALAGLLLLGILQLDLGHYFLILALLNLAVAAYVYSQVSEFFLRFVVWLLAHSIYRVKMQHLERIPDEGGLLLVCNHVSYVDALILAGAVQRPIRFVMDNQIFKTPVLGRFFKLCKAIAITSPHKDKTVYENAFKTIADELAQGNVVCIFPEGKLTTDGQLGEFKKGLERIVQETPVPVVPMALSGLWGSFFSHYGSPAFTHRPRWRWSKINLTVGQIVPADKVSAKLLQQRVDALLNN